MKSLMPCFQEKLLSFSHAEMSNYKRMKMIIPEEKRSEIKSVYRTQDELKR
jgi:hypothetical protein